MEATEEADTKWARHLNLLPVVAASIVVLGAKLLLIQRFGSNVPFWDQWDAEAAFLYKPYLEGTLGWSDLFAPHNEHRIFWSRVLSLGLLELGGLWLPKLQMVANAVLHAVVLGGLLCWLSRGLWPRQSLFLCALGAAVFAIPFGWANTLAGFQSQFYFVSGFSIAALWCFATAGAFSVRWFFGLAFAVAAYFSMASGALTLVAIVVLLGLQIAAGARAAKPRELLSVLVLSAATIATLAAVTHHPGHDTLKADGLGEFIVAFAKVAGWPARLEVLGAIVLNIPTAALLVDTVLKRRRLGDPAWAAIAAMLWLGTQWLSIAYGRVDSPTAPRYLDTLALGIVVNCCAALVLMQRRHTRWISVWFAIGLPFFATAVATDAAPRAFQGAANRGAAYQAQTTNLSTFFKSGDPTVLQGTTRLEIPYPDPDRLAVVAADPTVRKILHRSMTGQKPARLSLPAWFTRGVRTWMAALLQHAGFVLFLGLAAFGYCSVRLSHS